MDDMELEHYEHVVATHERKIDVWSQICGAKKSYYDQNI